MLCSNCNKNINDKYYVVHGLSHHYCHNCHQKILDEIKENVLGSIPLIQALGLDAKFDGNSLIVKKDSFIYEYSLNSSTLLNKSPEQICKKISKDIAIK